ncbi:MAG: S8 family serine peptidase [Leptospiraceae bacterium]|nr:S8 family serine peptidase [Leptospiraceae bacterium]
MLKYNFTVLIILISFISNCTTEKKDDSLLNLLLLKTYADSTRRLACNENTGDDPFYADQWHLNNTGTTTGSVEGEDVKVTSVWSGGNKGDGVTIAVVDDGLQTGHEDLKDNISTKVSGYNYANSSTNPNHIYSNSGHGTAVGGVAAARDLNGVGLRGAAPCAHLVGRNLLESTITNSNEGDSMSRDISLIDISNNSWGAADNTGQLTSSSSLWQAGIESGLTDGRGGKGTIYLWAGGNGGSYGIDNSNYDGQANYHGVLAIGGIGNNGKRALYSEEGANLWVVAHTQGNVYTGTPANTPTNTYTTAISTTDPIGENGYNYSEITSNYSNKNYSKTFNGTSSATPLAAGVIALLIKAYPNLTWRDIREILAKSARKNHTDDTDWKTNGANYNINHKYGFGAIDAASAISVASSWTSITTSLVTAETSETTDTSIPDNNSTGVTQTVNYSGSEINKIEFVDLNFTSNHGNAGNLIITLTSPSGTSAEITKQHNCYSGSNPVVCSYFSSGSKTYRFGVSRFLGENPAANGGTWSLKVVDSVSGYTGNFKYKLKFYGRKE